jgi:paraquat-inducible protein B
MGRRASPTVIGAFVVVAVVLAVTAVGVFGSGRFFRKVQACVLFFKGDVNGLQVGAPVKFKGIQIGTVKSILFSLGEVVEPDERARGLRIPVVIEIDEANIVKRGGRVHTDPKTVARLVDLGLRAQLKMESFVTGVLYIDLDMYPGTPADRQGGADTPYPEIPTLPTALEEAQQKAAAFLSRLDRLDINGLVESLRNTVASLNGLLASPSLKATLDGLPATVKKVDEGLEQLRRTLASVEGVSDEVKGEIQPLVERLDTAASSAAQAMLAARGAMQRVEVLLEPESPVVYQLGQTLSDLSLAAAAIRRFVEDLERNPSALVRGKAVTEGGK